MRLVVDVGNTRIKWGSWESGQLDNVDSMPLRDWDQQRIENAWGQNTFKSVWVSNVAGPEVAERINVFCQQCLSRTPVFVESRAREAGVVNGYTNPSSLGVDRWMSVIAAHHLIKKNCCVVNLGTAVTIDQLCADGQHLGGLIIPGLTTMIQALNMHTFGVKVTDFQVETDQSYARNTSEAVRLGVLNAISGAINQVFRDFSNRMDDAVCVLSGGDADIISTKLTMEMRQIPHLVLYGLGIVADCSNDGET